MRIYLDVSKLKEELEGYIGQSICQGSSMPQELRSGGLSKEAYDNWGGCGILERVFEEESCVWVCMDWGMSWVVFPSDAWVEDDYQREEPWID